MEINSVTVYFDDTVNLWNFSRNVHSLWFTILVRRGVIFLPHFYFQNNSQHMSGSQAEDPAYHFNPYTQKLSMFIGCVLALWVYNQELNFLILNLLYFVFLIE